MRNTIPARIRRGILSELGRCDWLVARPVSAGSQMHNPHDWILLRRERTRRAANRWVNQVGVPQWEEDFEVGLMSVPVDLDPELARQVPLYPYRDKPDVRIVRRSAD
jgi:hypothetical protein